MFNKVMIEKAEQKCGSFWSGGASIELIEGLMKTLEVQLPKSYKEFLSIYGEGGITGMYINGISDETYSSTEDDTKLFRERKGIKKEWVVIGRVKTSWEEYLVCLDTSEIKEQECPIIKYDLDTGEEEEIYKNFYEYFNDEVEQVYYK